MALIDEKEWSAMAKEMGIKPGFALSMGKLIAEGSVMTVLYSLRAGFRPAKEAVSKRAEELLD